MSRRTGVRPVQGDKREALRRGLDDGVVIGDREGNVVLVNPAAERVLGVSGGQVIGKPYGALLEPLGREDEAEMTAAIEQLLSCPVPGAARVIRVGLAAGARAVEIRLSPVVGRDGEVTGVAGVLRDVAKDAEVDRARSEFILSLIHI